LFLTHDAIEFFPLLLETKGFDDWIENFLSLNDLELRCNKARIKTSTASAVIEQPHVGVVLIDLHRYTRLVLPWQKIGYYSSCNNYKQENENDEWQTYSYNAPVIDEM
jgi:hypothetical protein